jgi:phosphoglycolate phosphatase-like HAD superfamily hydrolase
MHLVMFDIDGTLTQTCSADSECFIQAVSELLHLSQINPDWTRYRNVTDSGIAAEIIESACARPPANGELDRIRTRFAELLAQRFESDASLCHPIPGAAHLLSQLRALPDTALAIATGGWSRSAKLKLKKANLNIDGLPFASADDSHCRHEIMLIAKQRAASLHAVKHFDSFIYVGDALWDLLACQSLQIPLIGIGTGPRAAKLQAAGAKHLLPDYSNPQRFLDLILAARSA